MKTGCRKRASGLKVLRTKSEKAEQELVGVVGTLQLDAAMKKAALDANIRCG